MINNIIICLKLYCFIYSSLFFASRSILDSGYQYLSLHRLLIFVLFILCSRGLLATASIQQKGKISPV
ncbi:hypothetical protein DMI70_25525 [Escherichia coli]|nr:hypothetical protein [Escherichia coli]